LPEKKPTISAPTTIFSKGTLIIPKFGMKY
jgi:hypothetical protein